tara:strand:- start:25 stop:975 length:951 start_codon:yes stop_codon:yes gene_type:complete
MVSEQFYEIFKYQPDIRNIIFDHQKIMIAQDAKKILANMDHSMITLTKFGLSFDMKIQEYNRCNKSKKIDKKFIIKLMANLRKWSIEIEKYILPIFDTAKYGLHITDIIKFIDYDNQLWTRAPHALDWFHTIADGGMQPHTKLHNKSEYEYDNRIDLYGYNMFWTSTYKKLCTKYNLEYDIFSIDYHDAGFRLDKNKNFRHVEFNEVDESYEEDLDYFMEYITDNNLTDKIIIRKIITDSDIDPLYNMLEYGYDSRIDLYNNKLRFKKFERNIIFKNKSYKYFEYLVISIDEPRYAIASIIQTDFKLSDRENKWYE